MSLKNIHWMMSILQNIDVGIVVVDRDYKVCLWNGFMQNHSGKSYDMVMDQCLFNVFPDVPRQWFQHKIDSVFLLESKAFTIWEERPYVFKFDDYRPVTGTAEFMYQYSTLIPLRATDNQISHVGILLSDVTDIAMNQISLKKANLALVQLSTKDKMTGLLNRGHWEDKLALEFQRFNRCQTPVTLVMFDIDKFKLINDEYGHQPADQVIIALAKLLLSSKREIDLAGRYGGDEFGIILLNCNKENALIFTERLRTNVEKSEIKTLKHRIKYTISLGIAELNLQTKDHLDWIRQADAGLYKSKERGRNKSSVYQAAK
ncbi:MAG: sensor domain-containing diguanylate cyclase [Pseudomonadales bacterium]|nr:sensor domain-containing diguanylate cyclase [Pseudomonadales bacterium]